MKFFCAAVGGLSPLPAKDRYNSEISQVSYKPLASSKDKWAFIDSKIEEGIPTQSDKDGRGRWALNLLARKFCKATWDSSLRRQVGAKRLLL